MAMGPRITAFEERLAAGKTDQHVRATEASGEKLMQAIERFSAGPGAAVLSRIEAAANAEQGGMQTVMSRDAARWPLCHPALGVRHGA